MQCEFSAIKVSKKSNVTKVTNATFLFFVHGQNGIFSEKLYKDIKTTYRKVAISIPSCLEAYSRFFRLLKKGIFDPYVLWPVYKKSIF